MKYNALFPFNDVLSSPSQVYDAFSLRADSLMGEFKVFTLKFFFIARCDGWSSAKVFVFFLYLCDFFCSVNKIHPKPLHMFE